MPVTPVNPEATEPSAHEKEITLAQAQIDQAPEPEESQNGASGTAPEEDVIDVLRPKAKSVEWTIGKGEYERKYVQRPLSFIQKMQWFALVGEVLDKAMGGENALTVSNLLSGPQVRGGLSVNDFRDADTFVHAIGKLLVYAPDFLQRSYAIWLGVPDFEQEIAAQIMALPPEEGGLTDEQGLEIVEVFIDQNYEALDRFFRERLGQLQKRVQARMADARGQQSPQSKR